PEAATNWQGRLAATEHYTALVHFVEWKLIEMPLPRLQKMGVTTDDFVYVIAWNEKITKRTVDRYQAGSSPAFDNLVRLRPGVGGYLLQLNGLLRPLIHRRWCAMVAFLNKLEDSRLDEFLFGSHRVPTAEIRAGLWEIQDKRCFYCEARLPQPASGHVDHFIPWARYADNGIENLVIADAGCNGDKGSSLAAETHVARWAARLSSGRDVSAQLGELARTARWDRHPARTASVARAIYLGLPDTAKLWLRKKEFVGIDPAAVERALAAVGD
ncbi:MAG TPA: HNH endonuclease domain-containing protein, partial [Methylomirabilota bacterium]|nr:HNH endonuclease domain-containing protein [Methylomirabilota bacterium]